MITNMEGTLNREINISEDFESVIFFKSKLKIRKLKKSFKKLNNNDECIGIAIIVLLIEDEVLKQ